MKKIINNLKNKSHSFFRRFEFLKVYNSPFKAPKLKFYFGEVKVGTPYFLPRRAVKATEDWAWEQTMIDYHNPSHIHYRGGTIGLIEMQKRYLRYNMFVTKYIGFDFVPLGWKTKWTDTDFRYEYGPLWSFVFFKWQFVVRFIVPERDHYWECWLYYNNATDKSESKLERLKKSIKEFPCHWTQYPKVGDDAGKKIDFYGWDHILKNKYNGIRTNTEEMG